MHTRIEPHTPQVRTVRIFAFALALRAALASVDARLTYLGGKMTAERQAERRQAIAYWCVNQILELGPTFIKLGQLLSARSDLLPVEFVRALQTLQDRVPAFSPDLAVRTVEQELGGPLAAHFESFEREPLAAASLGQVHRARLKNSGGALVAVKVQRPGLKRLFEIDLAALKKLATAADEAEEGRDWSGIAAECDKVLRAEIDYIQEGANADKFRRNFYNSDWLRVPEVYWSLSTRRVLVLEYLPGVSVSDIATLAAGGVDLPAVARLATQAYLLQILRYGFFHGRGLAGARFRGRSFFLSLPQRLPRHSSRLALLPLSCPASLPTLTPPRPAPSPAADPHGGNVAVELPADGAAPLASSRPPRLIYYDFGMVGTIPPLTKQRLLSAFYAIAEQDVDVLLNTLLELGVLEIGPGGDRLAVKRAIAFFIANLQTKLSDREVRVCVR